VSDAALPGFELHLGAWAEAVSSRRAEWTRERSIDRLWTADHRLWVDEPQPELTDRLGWLRLPVEMRASLSDFEQLAGEATAATFDDVVLLGMGGSSLAPEVFQRVLGNAGGRPRLTVADSTHPGAVLGVDSALDPARTLFLVSSKSGGTLETLSLFRYFWARVDSMVGDPGSHFVAITDPGSSLEALARERGFRAVVLAPPDVGGRYSALSPFGLVPAALIGADTSALLDGAHAMAEACGGVEQNPGLDLGIALGELALAGRDKLTLLTSSRLASFPDWLEQLIAESTGKDDRGIVPVAGERPADPARYGNDRVFVAVTLEGDDTAGLEEFLRAVGGAGHPWARITLARPEQLGAEMFRWEMTTAVAGAVLRVNPFNQENVQLAKELAKRAMAGEDVAAGTSIDEVPVGDEVLEQRVRSWLGGIGEGDYIGLQAYLAAAVEVDERLSLLQQRLAQRSGRAVTAGYGPRFLHSTGQLHKGGANNGVFLQLVDAPEEYVAVPETEYGFGQLISAQADGDAAALLQRGRRLLRVHLGSDAAAGIDRLLAVVG
jgi:transaldolase/glucose-6-phosphate isomerase